LFFRFCLPLDIRAWSFGFVVASSLHCTNVGQLPLDHLGRHQYAMARGDALERFGRQFAGSRAGVVAPQTAQAVFITGSAHAALVHGRPAAPAKNDFTKEERHCGVLKEENDKARMSKDISNPKTKIRMTKETSNRKFTTDVGEHFVSLSFVFP
jgi:hypothetical protein